MGWRVAEAGPLGAVGAEPMRRAGPRTSHAGRVTSRYSPLARSLGAAGYGQLSRPVRPMAGLRVQARQRGVGSPSAGSSGGEEPPPWQACPLR